MSYRKIIYSVPSNKPKNIYLIGDLCEETRATPLYIFDDECSISLYDNTNNEWINDIKCKGYFSILDEEDFQYILSEIAKGDSDDYPDAESFHNARSAFKLESFYGDIGLTVYVDDHRKGKEKQCFIDFSVKLLDHYDPLHYVMEKCYKQNCNEYDNNNIDDYKIAIDFRIDVPNSNMVEEIDIRDYIK